eukprot:SM000089S23819  [mRNA]  locus=s89:109909:110254:+ [translate_table: standard]
MRSCYGCRKPGKRDKEMVRVNKRILAKRGRRGSREVLVQWDVRIGRKSAAKVESPNAILKIFVADETR